MTHRVWQLYALLMRQSAPQRRALMQCQGAICILQAGWRGGRQYISHLGSTQPGPARPGPSRLRPAKLQSLPKAAKPRVVPMQFISRPVMRDQTVQVRSFALVMGLYVSLRAVQSVWARCGFEVSMLGSIPWEMLYQPPSTSKRWHNYRNPIL